MTKRFLVQTGSVLSSMLLMISVAAVADQTQPATQTQPPGSSSAHHFIKEAAQGGLAEVTLGQMAADKGESKEVREFGRRMVQDHSKANDELKTLATAVGVPLPTEMSTEAKSFQQRLENLSGAEFDRAYMDEMLKDHMKDVSAFEKQAVDGQNAQVKEWAQKTLPTLREHLSLAQQTAKNVSAQNSMDRDASGGMSAAASEVQVIKGTKKSTDEGQ